MFMIVLYLWLFYEIMIDLTWESEKKNEFEIKLNEELDLHLCSFANVEFWSLQNF